MTTERKRWWRLAAIAVVGGGTISGGWYSFRHATAAPQPEAGPITWSSAASTPPAVAEVQRTADVHPTPEAAPPTGPVTPASGLLPIPTPDASPVVPAAPVAAPISIPTAPIPTPSIEPVTGPRAPDAGLLPADKNALPPIPTMPAIPSAEIPSLSPPPKIPEMKPLAPMGDGVIPLPPIPLGTPEPPKAPANPPSSPVAPVVPILPQPAEFTPSLPPVKPADSAPPMLPAKPDSGLKPNDSGNTLNPTVPPLAPIVPILPGGEAGRETPGKPVDRPKPPEPNLGSSDKYSFPVPVIPDPVVPPPRDDTMLRLSPTAVFAVLGGALLAVDQAKALPTIPVRPMIPMSGTQIKADEKTDIETLKKDLKTANEKIANLEKQVEKLTNQLNGKRDKDGILIDPKSPGAVEDVKELKNEIDKLKLDLNALRTQTSLKPSIGTPPATKPKGIVKVVNDYPVEITMLINNKTYRVSPNTKVEVEVLAGDFSYQLLQSGAPATNSVIKDKETVTLRIK